eukprot:TRINITY_DN5751_c0_g1_i5.p1 TRINITY_DN5751_c0_g1~~TRINITY_DN5751_c0_g1_i5.p1  ORF type:complete len:1192 (+),score=167.13 TRINITY_DN5751_c0_g1_i5:43-3618(+)
MDLELYPAMDLEPSFSAAVAQVEKSFDVLQQQVISAKMAIAVLTDVSGRIVHLPADAHAKIPSIRHWPASAPTTSPLRPGNADVDQNGDSNTCLEEPPALVAYNKDSKVTAAPAVAERRLSTASHATAPTNLSGSARASKEMLVEEGQERSLHALWRELDIRSSYILETRPEKPLILRRPAVQQTRKLSQMIKLPSLADVLHSGSRVLVSPHDWRRVIWDFVGLVLLLFDLVTLPVVLAWDIDSKVAANDDTGSWILAIGFWIALTYWSCDIPINMMTAYYENGTLVASMERVVRHYICTWFFFDLFVVLTDIVLYAVQGSTLLDALKGARSLRIVRSLRLLRLVKANKLAVIIDEATHASGKRWMPLLVAIVKTVVLATVSTHLAACVWFYVGDSTRQAVGHSWLVETDADAIDPNLQYLHSLSYIFAPPSPAPIRPDSATEKIFNLVIIVFVWLVIGTSVGTIGDAIAELRTMNERLIKERHKVSTYLQSMGTPIELQSRIMRFVDYKIKQRDSAHDVDVNLISPSLWNDLHASLRGHVVAIYPLFALVRTLHPGIFAVICGEFEQSIVGNEETVFAAGDVCHAMYLTTSDGQFTMTTDGLPKTLRDGRWFNELGLFLDSSVLTCSLVAETFSVVLTLSGVKFRTCVQNTPECARVICDYAKELLVKLSNTRFSEANATHDCAAHSVCKNLLDRMNSETYQDDSLAVAKLEISRECSPKGADAMDVRDLIRNCLKQDFTDQSIIQQALCTALPELHPSQGTYALFSQTVERERSVSSCLCILNLSANQFDQFISPQKASVQLSPSQWQELQELIRWVKPGEEQIHTVLVLLAIYLLGKNKKLVRQFPKEFQKPETAAVMHMMSDSDAINAVPSVQSLSKKSFELIRKTVDIYSRFNLGQLIQGENTPANVLELQNLVGEDVDLLKFYVFFFLGLMSGLQAGAGSKFMNSSNASSIILACRALQSLTLSSPQAIYWNYIVSRAGQLRMRTETAEDLVLGRLACISHAKDAAALHLLSGAWQSLNAARRQSLMDVFLADGIKHRSCVLKFLPLCISNALKNPVVKLVHLFEVLVDLTRRFAVLVEGRAELAACSLITMDLSELAEFIKALRNRFVFQTCVSRCQFKLDGQQVLVVMGHGNWIRCDELENDTTRLANDVKDILATLDAQDLRNLQDRGVVGEPTAITMRMSM